ncbi:MAG: Rnase Y domain-containing protein, partial [Candidatus Falkowbacteria bacterium]|nr:Rnase Y domain-containing protein [Candidatus Falkowbacteria bacterium]
MEFIIYGILGIGIIGGFLIGYWLRRLRISQKIISAEQKAEKILADVKNKQNELLLKAQEKALRIIEEAKEEEKKRRQELNNLQVRLEKRETTFSQKLLELQDKQQKLYDRINKVEEAKEKIQKIKEEQLAKLEKISNLTREEAKEVLLKNVETQMKDDILSRIKKLEGETTEMLEEKARDLLISTMQRLVSNYTAEITTTVVELPNDEMKG